VELEESKTGVKHIYSAGKSEKGMLGQGDKVKESREFKKIFYESDDLAFTTISVGSESVMAIDSAG
jgi:alpha-tubulin suppressor-like RCC1 family protein